MIHRLKEVRKELGFNQTDFAKHLGITQTAYSMIENGNRPLADKYVKVICSAFNVNENWFITGEGEMFLSSPYEKEFIDIFSRLAPETQQYLLLMAKELLKTQERLLESKDKQQAGGNGGGDLERKDVPEKDLHSERLSEAVSPMIWGFMESETPLF